MNNLVVDRKLASLVTNHENTDATAAIGKGFAQLLHQALLFNYRQPLSDIPRLGHCNNTSIVTYVKDAVLLEDRAKHGLHNNAWTRGRYEACLLMELLGEEINTKIVQLAGMSRCGNANDLADVSLENQEIAITDVVAWDADGVWRTISPGGTAALGRHWGRCRNFFTDFAFDNHFLAVVMVVVMERVKDTVGSSL